jgi:nucleoside-diphosphate-sugar epimerase
MSEVLVTGGAGLIGAAICRRLRASGHRILATCRESPPNLGQDIEWLLTDLRDDGSLNGLRPDAVAHCAAAVPATFTDSESAAQTNRAIDENVFSFAQGTGARLIYASGASLYGDGLPSSPGGWRETDRLAPLGPYLSEKAWAESRGAKFAGRTGWEFTALRINAPFGPAQRARTVIVRFLADAVGGNPLRYYGDGTREQDFTYVDDVARAFEAALAGPCGIYNVSGGEPVSMHELARIVAEVTGLDPGLVMPAGIRDPQEGRQARFDLSAARRALGWSPQTALRDGIAQCLRRVGHPA